MWLPVENSIPHPSGLNCLPHGKSRNTDLPMGQNLSKRFDKNYINEAVPKLQLLEQLP
jgi:hypothetical protein